MTSLWYKIFIGSVILALMDSFDEVLFGGNGFLGDFSLIATLIAIAYVIGAFIIWIFFALQSIVFLEFIEPLAVLLQLFMMMVGIVGGSLTDFIFNSIKFPFEAIANLAHSFGVDTLWWIGIPDFFGSGAAAAIDLETMTFMVGFKFNVGVTALQASFNVSILGIAKQNNFIEGGFDFGAVKALGIGTRIRFTLGGTVDETIAVSIQALIEGAFEAIQIDADPQQVFESLIQKVQELGYKLGLG